MAAPSLPKKPKRPIDVSASLPRSASWYLLGIEAFGITKGRRCLRMAAPSSPKTSLRYVHVSASLPHSTFRHLRRT